MPKATEPQPEVSSFRGTPVLGAGRLVELGRVRESLVDVAGLSSFDASRSYRLTPGLPLCTVSNRDQRTSFCLFWC